jgi:hypothetical protein
VTRTALIANALMFQLCWLAFVAGAGRGNAWIGFVPLAMFAAWQLRASRARRADVELMLVAGALGFGVDTSYVQAGALHYAAAFPSPELAPVWIVGMWMAFALTLNHSLDFLKHNLLASISLGLVGAPIAYAIAAGRFGAASFDGTALFALALVGLAWGALTPLLARLAGWLVARGAAPSHA